MSTALSTLTPLLHIPRCPEPLVLQALRNACRQFCRDTEIWRVRLTPGETVKGQYGYRFETGQSDTLFIRIPEVRVGGCPVPEDRYSVSEGVLIYDFDGSDDVLTLADPITLDSDDTFEFQVTPDATPSGLHYTFKDSSTNFIAMFLSGSLQLSLGGTGATWSSVFAQGVNAHVKLVRNGTSSELFLNGVSQGSNPTGSDTVTFTLMGTNLDGRIWDVRKNGTPLDTFSGTAAGTPAVIDGQTLLEFKEPYTTSGKEILVDGILVPTRVCSEVDNNLLARWGEYIVAGAEFNLKSQLGSEQDPNPWYDPEGAALARGEYQDGVTAAKMEVYGSRQSGDKQVDLMGRGW